MKDEPKSFSFAEVRDRTKETVGPDEYFLNTKYPKGKVSLMLGKTGTCKSFLLLDLALRAAKEGKRVFYFKEKYHQHIGVRIKSWLSYYGESPEKNLTIIDSNKIDLWDKEFITTLENHISQGPPDLVIFNKITQLGTQKNGDYIGFSSHKGVDQLEIIFELFQKANKETTIVFSTSDVKVEGERKELRNLISISDAVFVIEREMGGKGSPFINVRCARNFYDEANGSISSYILTPHESSCVLAITDPKPIFTYPQIDDEEWSILVFLAQNEYIDESISADEMCEKAHFDRKESMKLLNLLKKKKLISQLKDKSWAISGKGIELIYLLENNLLNKPVDI